MLDVNFRQIIDTIGTGGIVMVVAVLGLVVLFATAGELGKRAAKTAPQAGDVDDGTTSETRAARTP